MLPARLLARLDSCSGEAARQVEAPTVYGEAELGMAQPGNEQEHRTAQQAIRTVLLMDAEVALSALPETLSPLAPQERGPRRQSLEDLTARAAEAMSWLTSAAERGRADLQRTAARLGIDEQVLWECGEAGAELERSRPSLLAELAAEPDAELRSLATRLLASFLTGVLLHVERPDGPRTLVGHVHVFAADQPLTGARLDWRCTASRTGHMQVEIRPPAGAADSWLVDRFVAASAEQAVSTEVAGAAMGRVLLAAALWQLWHIVPPDPDDWNEGDDDGGPGDEPPPPPDTPPGGPNARVSPTHTTATPGQRGAARTRRTTSVATH